MKEKFKYAIITILLGAMGSGLWEKFISEILNYIFISISKFLIYQSEYYSNRCYKNISNGNDDQFTVYLGLSIISFSIMTAFMANIIINGNFIKDDIKDNMNEYSKKINDFLKYNIIGKIIKKSLFIYICYGSIFILVNFSLGMYINTVSTRLLNNIEIVSPYIKDKDYKILKSEFYSITNKNDYYRFINKINKMNKKFNIKFRY
jgi:hypothetical protein